MPDKATVFCSFNNNYKLNPDVFDVWMRILKRVEDSVLWLLADNSWSAANLAREAQARGIGRERLVFADRMPVEDHLARHRLADLFLDTWPCSAHTTASDALWAGLPLLTYQGETFAGRVASSLLTSLGLEALIATTPEAYEDLAVKLGGSPRQLAKLKQKLHQNKKTSPLFDTKLFTRNLEAAFSEMYERCMAGQSPAHIQL